MRPNKGTINKKWLALVALVVQNSLQSIVMRYTLVTGEVSARYMTSTAVLMSEVMKLCISVLCCFVIDAGANVAKFKSVLKTEASGSADWLKLGGACRLQGGNRYCLLRYPRTALAWARVGPLSADRSISGTIY